MSESDMRVLKLTTKDADTWSKVGEHEIYAASAGQWLAGGELTDAAWARIEPLLPAGGVVAGIGEITGR